MVKEVFQRREIMGLGELVYKELTQMTIIMALQSNWIMRK